MQEAWLAVLKGLDRFEGRSTLRTWVLQIVANIARDRAVREARSLPFSSLELEDEEPAVEPERFRRRRRALSRRLEVVPDRLANAARVAAARARDASTSSAARSPTLPEAQRHRDHAPRRDRVRRGRGLRDARDQRRETSASCSIAHGYGCARSSRGTSMAEPRREFAARLHVPGGRRARLRVPRGCDDAGADDRVRAASELLRRLLPLRRSGPDDRGDGAARLPEEEIPDETEGQAARRPSGTGSANEGLQVPHRRRPGCVQPLRLAAARRRARGVGRVRGRALPVRHPRVPTDRPSVLARARAVRDRARRPGRRAADQGRRAARAADPPHRRVERRDAARRTRRCASRARTSSSPAAPERLGGWAPPPEIAARRRRPSSASSTARIAEQLGGTDAHLEERRRQSEWLVEQLELD